MIGEASMNPLFVTAAVGALALHAIGVGAAQRTFFASGGNDANACSFALPCRSFAAAILHTDPKGEVIVLDSAGYGNVTIDRPVAIIAPPGVYAGISVFAGQDGVTVSAGAGDAVVLRGLTINGQGGDRGIVVNQAGRVAVQRCVVSNMGGVGILVEESTPALKLSIDDTKVSNNVGDGVRIDSGDLLMTNSHVENNGGNGVRLVNDTPPNTIQAVIRSSVLAGNASNGVEAIGLITATAIQVTVEESSAVRNVGNGFWAVTGASTPITFVLTRSVASRNGGVGFYAAGSTVTASVSGSTLARNYTYDLRQGNGAVLRSHGNNALSGDGPGNVSGTITPIGLD
jgi:hypothetical protein